MTRPMHPAKKEAHCRVWINGISSCGSSNDGGLLTHLIAHRLVHLCDIIATVSGGQGGLVCVRYPRKRGLKL